MDRRRIVSLYLRNRRDCQFGLSRRISGKNLSDSLSSVTQQISFSASDRVISINFSPIDRWKHRWNTWRNPSPFSVWEKIVSSLFTFTSPRPDITRIVRIKKKKKLWNEIVECSKSDSFELARLKYNLEEIIRFFPSLESNPLNNL